MYDPKQGDTTCRPHCRLGAEGPPPRRCGRRATIRRWSRPSCCRSGPRLVEACGIGAGDASARRGRRHRQRLDPGGERGAEVTASDLTPELLDAGRGAGREPRASSSSGSKPTPRTCLRRRVLRRRHVFDRRDVRASPPGRGRRAGSRLPPGGTIGLLSWTPEGMLGALFRTMGPFARRRRRAPSRRRSGAARITSRICSATGSIGHARARRARDHRVRAAAGLRRALQGALWADDRRAGQRGERPRGGVRRRAGRVLRRVEPRHEDDARFEKEYLIAVGDALSVAAEGLSGGACGGAVSQRGTQRSPDRRLRREALHRLALHGPNTGARPNFRASARRRSAWPTERSSPARPTSPKQASGVPVASARARRGGLRRRRAPPRGRPPARRPARRRRCSRRRPRLRAPVRRGAPAPRGSSPGGCGRRRSPRAGRHDLASARQAPAPRRGAAACPPSSRGRRAGRR